MSGFKIPLEISGNSIYNKNVTDDVKKSIEDFIILIINSSNGSFLPDREFGFSLKNSRYIKNDSEDKIDQKKINSSCSSVGSYSYKLKEVIKKYEPRLLEPIKVEMKLDKKKQDVLIFISGNYRDRSGIKNNYEQKLKFHIW